MNVEQLLSATGIKGSVIGRTFELLGVAEEEITQAKRGTRDKATKTRINDAFKVLVPGILREFEDTLYRAHCREMIERCKAGQDTRPATRAEVLAHLSRMSLAAPPGQQWAALQEDLFVVVLKKRPDGRPIAEPWPHASAELLAQLRSTFRVEDRR